MSFEKSSLKKHLVINLEPLIALGISLIAYQFGIFDLPVIGLLLEFLVGIINIPASVVFIGSMFIQYYILVPFVLYYSYVIVKVIYNVFYLKNRINIMHFLIISICMIVTIVLIILGVEEAVIAGKKIMSV